jgi:hypothetical protein
MNCGAQKIRMKTNAYAAWTLLLVGLLSFGQSRAALVETLDYDLTQAPTPLPGYNPGNSFIYTDTGPTSGDSFAIEIFAWSQTGADLGSGNTFAQATAVHVGNITGNNPEPLGLGVCSANELPIANCTGDKKARAMDSKDDVDWLLVIFPDYMDINSFVVTPEENKERDLTYFTGRIDSASDIAGLSPADLAGFTAGNGWNAGVDVGLGKGKKAKKGQPFVSQAATVNVSHQYHVNALLIGARSTTDKKGKAKPSYITLTNVNVSTVPIPAAVWMLGSALGALLFGRRINRKAQPET